MQLNDDKTAAPRVPKKRNPKPTLAMPDDLKKALARTRGAATHFEKFAPSRQREYIEWISDAKSDATRQRRLATAVEWIAEGKPRRWKYQKRRRAQSGFRSWRRRAQALILNRTIDRRRQNSVRGAGVRRITAH